MIPPNWVVYVLFGSMFSVGAQGFPDKVQCEAFKAELVKAFRPTKSACLEWKIVHPDEAKK